MTRPKTHPLFPDLTVQVVRELLDYNPGNGHLTWRHYRGPKARAGDEAGMVTPRGHCIVTLFGHKLPASHVCWVHEYRYWPEEKLHPRDGDHTNLKIENWVPHASFVSQNPYLAKRREYYRNWRASKRDDPNRPDEDIDREIANEEAQLARQAQREQDAAAIRHPVTLRKRRRDTRTAKE